MVFLDCERLKVPDTGIYYFCKNLASAIIGASANGNGPEIEVFLRKKNAGILGSNCKYLIYRSIYKYIFPYWVLRDNVWHTMFQYPLIMPGKGRTVLTVHDLNYLYEDLPEDRRKDLRNKVQEAIDRAAYIVAISEYTRKDILSNLDTHGKPVKVIYNGCNEYTGRTEVPEYKPERGFLFTVGGLLPKKNFHTLPCLLEGNDMEMVIAGPISEYAEKIMEEAKIYNVSDRVHIVGAIPEAAKHWYLQNCTAFLFPSIAEGFGLPVLEAMYYGKPVFISRHTSLPEIGGDKAFYFNYDFERKLMQKEFRQGMESYRNGKPGPDEISSHAKKFSWDAAARQYLEIYKELSDNA